MAAPYEQWVWLETEPDGSSGMITASIPQLGTGQFPLAHRKEWIARDKLGPIAREHGRRTGRPVRLALMREVTDNT